MSTAAARADLPQAGRLCPRDYNYAPSVFACEPHVQAEVLYVVGGLYGNLAALDAVEALAAQEPTPVTVVFNGDYHWFDAEPDWFANIEARVAKHVRIRGNVETEIARPDDIGAGCGCAYPEGVSDDVVARSNVILEELRAATVTVPSVREQLRHLPMHRVAQVGALRVGIVHGDATALAGWRFAQDALDAPTSRPWLTDIARLAQVDVFASTHTCLAALRRFALPSGPLTIINNGAAGMPNFSGSRFGLISRIATTPSPNRPLYGAIERGVHIDALALAYDHGAFLTRFLARWPQGSPSHASYFSRIIGGPDYALSQATRP